MSNSIAVEASACADAGYGAAGRAAAGGAVEPRLVTRGERVSEGQEAGPHLALIDWLAFTVPPAEGRDWRWLRQALEEIFGIAREAWVGSGGSVVWVPASG